MWEIRVAVPHPVAMSRRVSPVPSLPWNNQLIKSANSLILHPLELYCTYLLNFWIGHSVYLIPVEKLKKKDTFSLVTVGLARLHCCKRKNQKKGGVLFPGSFFFFSFLLWLFTSFEILKNLYMDILSSLRFYILLLLKSTEREGKNNKRGGSG